MSVDPPAKPPRLTSELVELVRAVVDSDENSQENDWIEWKLGEIDLTTKIGAFKIARQVLGFANRDPASAKRNADGHAYVVLGACPGQMTGVSVVPDSADVEQGISRYVGTSDGPRWDWKQLSLDGASVLVFIIDPPELGDPIFMLRKAYQREDETEKASGREGAIFVRRNGRTELASVAETQMLVRRSSSASETANVTVTDSAGGEVLAFDPFDESLRKSLDGVRANLMSQLQSPARTRTRAETFALAARDRRSPEAFTLEVDEYIEELRNYLRDCAIANAVEKDLIQVRFLIENHSSFGLEDVVFSAEASGDFSGQVAIASDVSGFSSVPPEPRAFGSIRSILAPSIELAKLARPKLALNEPSYTACGNGFQFKQTIKSIHASRSFEAEPIAVLVNPDLRGREIDVRWKLTSRNHAPIVGTMPLKIKETRLDVEAFAMALLASRVEN